MRRRGSALLLAVIVVTATACIETIRGGGTLAEDSPTPTPGSTVTVTVTATVTATVTMTPTPGLVHVIVHDATSQLPCGSVPVVSSRNGVILDQKVTGADGSADLAAASDGADVAAYQPSSHYRMAKLGLAPGGSAKLPLSCIGFPNISVDVTVTADPALAGAIAYATLDRNGTQLGTLASGSQMFTMNASLDFSRPGILWVFDGARTSAAVVRGITMSTSASVALAPLPTFDIQVNVPATPGTGLAVTRIQADPIVDDRYIGQNGDYVSGFSDPLSNGILVSLPDRVLHAANGVRVSVVLENPSGSIVELVSVADGPPSSVLVDTSVRPPVANSAVTSSGSTVSWMLDSYGSATTGLVRRHYAIGGEEEIFFPVTDCGSSCSVTLPPYPPAYAIGPSSVTNVVEYHLLQASTYDDADKAIAWQPAAIPLCRSTSDASPTFLDR